jgi:hypothetical protein
MLSHPFGIVICHQLLLQPFEFLLMGEKEHRHVTLQVIKESSNVQRLKAF